MRRFSRAQCFVSLIRHRAHAEVGLIIDRLSQAIANDRVVIDQQNGNFLFGTPYTHIVRGTRQDTVVPLSLLVISSSPRMTVARYLMICSPIPPLRFVEANDDGSCSPFPLSLISSSIASLVRPSRIEIRPAPLCLAALFTASCAIRYR